MSHRFACPQNHERTSENTYVDKQGRRHCKICRSAQQKRWRSDNREAVRVLNRAYHHRHREACNLKRKIRKALAA